MRYAVIFLKNVIPHASGAPEFQQTALNGKGFLTEECRLRLVSKEKPDCCARVPGALVLSRDERT